MEQVIQKSRGRVLERTFLLLIVALMAFLFFALYTVLEKDVNGQSSVQGLWMDFFWPYSDIISAHFDNPYLQSTCQPISFHSLTMKRQSLETSRQKSLAVRSV